jgi:hypothetical protein
MRIRVPHSTFRNKTVNLKAGCKPSAILNRKCAPLTALFSPSGVGYDGVFPAQRSKPRKETKELNLGRQLRYDEYDVLRVV